MQRIEWGEVNICGGANRTYSRLQVCHYKCVCVCVGARMRAHVAMWREKGGGVRSPDCAVGQPAIVQQDLLSKHGHVRAGCVGPATTPASGCQRRQARTQ